MKNFMLGTVLGILFILSVLNVKASYTGGPAMYVQDNQPLVFSATTRFNTTSNYNHTVYPSGAMTYVSDGSPGQAITVAGTGCIAEMVVATWVCLP